MDGGHYFWVLRILPVLCSSAFQIICGEFSIYQTFVKYNKIELLKNKNKTKIPAQFFLLLASADTKLFCQVSTKFFKAFINVCTNLTEYYITSLV